MPDTQTEVNVHRQTLARLVVGYAKSGQTAVAPDVLQEDVAFYLDPEMYAQEHRRFFRETPLVACLSQDLPQSGSYLTFDDAGPPILVWRGKDGAVRAFLNICAHRGARLGREACGQANRLSCRFHGWTYDTTGRAIGVPEEKYFGAAIEDQKQLIAIPCEERHGLVFVLADPDGRMDLDAHLGDFGAELDTLGLGQSIRVTEDELTAPSNWKYTLDTYFENYHLPVLHRDSFARVFAPDLAHFQTFGLHHRFTFAHASITEWMHRPETEWPVDTAVPVTYFLFPNTSIAVGSASPTGALISVHRLFPRAVGELATKIAIYAPPGAQTPGRLEEIKQTFEVLKRGVRDEDYAVTGESYAALGELPAGATFPIGRNEIGVQNFHHNVRKLLSVS